MTEAPSIQHPFRTAKIAVYQRIAGENAPEFMAKIEPIRSHPIFFTGSTAVATAKAAREWMKEKADEHEARYIAKETARQARKSKTNPEGDE